MDTSKTISRKRKASTDHVSETRAVVARELACLQRATGKRSRTIQDDVLSWDLLHETAPTWCDLQLTAMGLSPGLNTLDGDVQKLLCIDAERALSRRSTSNLMSPRRFYRLNGYRVTNVAAFGGREVDFNTFQKMKREDTFRYQQLLANFCKELSSNDVLLISEDTRVKVTSSVATLGTKGGHGSHAGASVSQISAVILVQSVSEAAMRFDRRGHC